jgi:hypothetical protein
MLEKLLQTKNANLSAPSGWRNGQDVRAGAHISAPPNQNVIIANWNRCEAVHRSFAGFREFVARAIGGTKIAQVVSHGKRQDDNA